jgi:hypothetical protein
MTAVGGQEAVVTGGADGFIAAYAAADGHPVRRLYTGAPVVDLAPLTDGSIAVANRAGVLALDSAWQVCGQHVISVEHMRPFGANRVVIARPDGRLAMLYRDL